MEREYGVGRGASDLLIRKPLPDGEVQREAVEMKVWAAKKSDPLADGLSQLDRYLDRLGLETGTIFDRRKNADPITERVTFGAERSPTGRTITLLRAYPQTRLERPQGRDQVCVAVSRCATPRR